MVRTPVRTPNDSRIGYTSRLCSNTEIRQLHRAILVGEDVRALDIAVDNTLVVEIQQTL